MSKDAPWSSKHIIDMLCPPLEESGNPVVCYPVAGYALGVKAKWEPMQEGSGTPSPENIRPIKGRDSVTVNQADRLRAWKMLTLDGATNKFTQNGVYWNLPKNSAPGTNNSYDTICSHFPANTFGGNSSKEYLFTKTQLMSKYFSDANALNAYLAAQYAAGTPVQICYKLAELVVVPDTNGIFFSEQPAQGGSGDPSPDNIRPILLNNTVQVGQTTHLTLPETVYGGEVDAVSGEVAETWGLVTFDGTENWVVSGKFLDNKTDWYYTLPKIPNAVNAVPQKGNEICSHYPHADVSNNNNVQGCAIVLGNIRVRWGDTIPNDADAWKAYLAAQKAAGTPVQVAYKLATQTPFTATGAQPIPALAGMNTVLTDADSATVTGRADPIKRITDLEDAVASQT